MTSPAAASPASASSAPPPASWGPPPRVATEVPGPSGGALAAIRRLRSDPLTRLTELHREYGPIVRLTNWPVSAFLVSDPEVAADALVSGHRAYAKGAVVRGTVTQPLTYLLGDGLLTSAGEAHRRQRRLIQPLFHKHRIAEYGEQFVAITDATAAAWRDGEQLDLHAEMTEMTLAIVARTLFDVPLDDHVVEVVRAAVARNLPAARRAAMPGFGRFEQLPLRGPRQRRDSREALDRAVHEMIAARRAAGATGTDLLSLLLNAQDADTGERMSDLQIRDEAMTLLLAGHETTANALAWTFHLLGNAPEVAERLHAEVDAVLDGRAPTVADLPALAYANAVFSESMRLYPPVWATGRHLVEDREIAGYLLPAGSTVVLSQWVIHRDERWWPEPTRFDPARWLGTPERAHDRPDGHVVDAVQGCPHAQPRPRFAYFPFGGGPRQCIGNSFAVTEGVLALATIARRWAFTAATDAPVVPEAMVTLRPRGGLPMIARRRH
jgi:cytochrome P450